MVSRIQLLCIADLDYQLNTDIVLEKMLHFLVPFHEVKRPIDMYVQTEKNLPEFCLKSFVVPLFGVPCFRFLF